MPTTNTVVLTSVIEALGPLVTSPAEALARLEHVFGDKLLIVAGDVQTVHQQADDLRLAITTPESAQVLDYIGTHALAGVSIETTEEVINALFPDRFMEP